MTSHYALAARSSGDVGRFRSILVRHSSIAICNTVTLGYILPVNLARVASLIGLH